MQKGKSVILALLLVYPGIQGIQKGFARIGNGEISIVSIDGAFVFDVGEILVNRIGSTSCWVIAILEDRLGRGVITKFTYLGIAGIGKLVYIIIQKQIALFTIVENASCL